MKCEKAKCKWYDIDYADPNRTPWCLLADGPIPNGACIVPDRDERTENVEAIEKGLADIAEELPALNTGLLAGLYGFEAICKEDKQ